VRQTRPLGRPSHRWEDNIKVDLREVECGSMDCIELAQDTDRRREIVNAVLNLWVLDYLTSYKPVSFSRRNLLHGVSE
jgi:hypothetical protein